MDTNPLRSCRRHWLAVALALGLGPPVTAQDLGELCAKALCESRQVGISSGEFVAEVLATFSRPAVSPESRLLLTSDGLLYGTTSEGGDFDFGTIFRISPAGDYTALHSFNDASGAFPRAGLVQDASGNFYGTAGAGGFGGFGTVYRMTPGGSVTVLHDFEYDDGWDPAAALTLGSDGRLYATTRSGGSHDLGTVFSISTDGQQFSNLHSFDGAAGMFPAAPLVQAPDGHFYGTTESGGPADLGTVFRISPAGEFTSIHGFSGADGQSPSGGLVTGADGALYGLTYEGGPNAEEFVGGAIYRITTDGAFSVLHGFPSENGQGYFPVGELLLASDGNFYGVTEFGGAQFSGTVFRVAQDGSNLQTVLHLTDGRNQNPVAGLAQDASGVIYGTTESGGRFFAGSIFALNSDASVALLHEFGAASGHRPTGLTAARGMVYGSTTKGGQEGRGTVFSLGPSQPLQAVHDFGEIGSDPSSPPILADDGRLYGTTTQGGQAAFTGIVYRLEPDGTLTLLHEFLDDDGQFPIGGLTQANDGSFYGSAVDGGDHGFGTIFRVDGGGSFQRLHSFDGANGASPFYPPIQASDGNFYGTTESGGDTDAGVAYQITPAGQYQVLHHFAFDGGDFPQAGLVEGPDGLLYGTTSFGGDFGEGVVFRISRNGQHEVLHDFIGPEDGSNPKAPLLFKPGGGFYGTTQSGGEFGLGTVFELSSDGRLQTLHQFGGADGAFPSGPLALLDGELYVSTAHFGTAGGGTVLRFAPDVSNPVADSDGGGSGGGSGALPPFGLMLIAVLAAVRRRRATLRRGPAAG